MPSVKYDQHYRADPAACGEPFAEFAAFCREAAPGTVLDLGCGQGRDALMFARAGHRVVGVDVSVVGIEQMVAAARAQGLAVDGLVDDIVTFQPAEAFDLVVLDRVLHMLPEAARSTALANAMGAVAPGGHLLVAEGPKGMLPVREAIEARGWSLPKASRNRLIARRPCTAEFTETRGQT
jgi:SAM-dependent methyltransferase